MRRLSLTIRRPAPLQWRPLLVGLALDLALVGVAQPARGQIFQPTAPTNAPADQSADPLADEPVGTPDDSTADEQPDAATGASADGQAGAPADGQAGAPADGQAGAPADGQAEAAPGTLALARAARRAACRPSSPAVGPVPGRSIVVDRGPSECQTVALTFDAGADRGYAELILDILREQQVPASFGMTGMWAEKNPDLLERMVDDGHELINHTWDHGSFTGFSPRTRPLGPAERRSQLDRTDELVVGLTGTSTRPYFRPPYGDLNDGVLKDVSDDGYDYTIMWTVDSLGWNHLPAPGIVERCLSRAAPGAIYIFHVGADSQDAQALGSVIAGLREQGYGFVTITDLLGL